MSTFFVAVQAIGTLLFGIAAIGSWLTSVNNGRKADHISKKTELIAKDVVTLVDQTNGVMDRLEATAKAIGVVEGREIQRKEDEK